MIYSKQEIAKLFKNYIPIGHNICDKNGKSIKLGDKVLNNKNNKIVIINESVLKTLDFSIEVLKNSKNNLTLIEDIEKQVCRSTITDDKDKSYKDTSSLIAAPNNADEKLDNISIKKLKSVFDLVSIESFENYQRLIIADFVDNANGISKSVWFDIKILKEKSQLYGNFNVKKPNYFINSVLGEIVCFLPFIIKFKKSKEQENCQSATLEFLEFTSIWRYNNDLNNNEEYIKKCLPKSNIEIIELLKNKIEKLTQDNRYNSGKFDGFWWENENRTFKIGDTLSDIEILERVRNITRISFAPVKNYTKHFVDYANGQYIVKKSCYRDEMRYLCIMDHKGQVTSNFGNIIANYDLNDAEFINWIRRWFDIKKKEEISNDEAMRMILKIYYNRLFGEDYMLIINNSKKHLNYSDFKKEFSKLFKEKNISFKNDCGESSYMKDGFHKTLDFKNGKEDYIKLTRDNTYMKLHSIGHTNHQEIIEELIGVNAINKRAFELFYNKEAAEIYKKIGQGTLF